MAANISYAENFKAEIAVVKRNCVLRRTSRSVLGTAAIFAAGCQSHLPPLQTEPYHGHVTPADISADINCELATIVAVAGNEQTKSTGAALTDIESRMSAAVRQTRADAYSETLVRLQDLFKGYDASAGSDLLQLMKHLLDDHFVAAVQLTLDVTDSEGFAPSLNKVTPYALGSNNRTLTLGGQLNGTQDRTITLTNSIDFESLKPPAGKDLAEGYCRKITVDAGAALGSVVLGSNGALLGDLGLADIIADGLRSLDDSSRVNLYGGTGPTRPVETASVRLNLDHISPIPPLAAASPPSPPSPPPSIGPHGALDGALTFTPPAPGTYAPETATLVGVLTLNLTTAAASPLTYTVNISGAVISEPLPRPGDVTTEVTASAARLALQGALLADIGNPPSGTPGATPTLIISGRSRSGKLDDLKFQGQIVASNSSGTSSYSFGGSVYKPETEHRNVSYFASPALAAAAAPASPAGPSGGSKGGASAGASPAGSTSFGSTVDFTLVYGLNGGPNWTLTHFKGPAPSSPLLTASRTETNTMNITFVPACRTTDPAAADDLALIAPKLTDFWSTLSPCDADNVNVGSATAAANQLNLLLRLR